ncbi:MAG: ABC transporter substrate-binding protein [Holosporaceae bacterium]|jgi:ABC-type transporter MlaC component|nr:ABC transporter substrate-binding protein [Holosporaceae bacterium]
MNKIYSLLFCTITFFGLPSTGSCENNADKSTNSSGTTEDKQLANIPRKLVEQVIRDAISLVSSDVTVDQFKEKIKDIVSKTFATESVARFILGSNAKKITAEELKTFVDACTNMMISFYSSKLYEYRNASAEVIKVTKKSSNHWVVRTQVSKNGGNKSDKLTVDWSVYMIKEAPRIFDVIIDEISMGQAQRAGISGIIKKKGLKKFLSDFAMENKTLK